MPDRTADGELSDALARTILRDHSAGGVDGTSDTMDPAEHLVLVSRCAEAEQVTRELLARSVAAARGAGHSWSAVGDQLGLTRQAVQQRFGASADDADGPTHRWLGPVTAFDEMPELALAGQQGWRTVEAGMLRHRMRRTDTQWEHRRVVWTRPVRHYEEGGWEVGCRAFPWLYLVRDLGLSPVDPGEDG